MSKINDWLTRIADIEIGISVPGLPIPYVLQAEPYQPSDMNSVSCPFFVNEIFPGPTNIPIASGMQYRETNVNLMLAIARREGAIDLKYNISNSLQWGDAVLETFAQHVKLSAPSKTIVSSTNANPIQIVTAAPHRFNSGDQVTITGHAVNTNANGTWNVTVVDYQTFTIPAVGNGAGAQTGLARLTQPVDMPHIVEAVIGMWDLVPYAYGSTDPEEPNFIALKFPLRVREWYVTTITA